MKLLSSPMGILFATILVFALIYIMFHVLFLALKYAWQSKKDTQNESALSELHYYGDSYRDILDNIHNAQNFFDIAGCAASIEIFKMNYMRCDIYAAKDAEVLWDVLKAKEDEIKNVKPLLNSKPLLN